MAKAVRLRVNVGASFPAQVVGAGGIDVLKSNGIYTIQLNRAFSWPLNLATQAQAEAGIEPAKLMAPLTVSQAIQVNALGFKNIAGRNGGFEVWQRLAAGATSIAVPAAATQYTCDGFYVQTQASQAATVTQVAGLSPGSRYAAKVQRNAGQTGTGTFRFAMPLDIDEVLKAAGNCLVMSFLVKGGANWSPAGGVLSFVVNFGTGPVAKRAGTPYPGETTPITQQIALVPGGGVQQVISAVSVPVGANVTCAEIRFACVPVGTAGADDSFTIDDLDIRVVPAGMAPITPSFERTEYIWDLLRCARHFYAFARGIASQQVMAFGSAFATTAFYFALTLPVPPRAAPSVSLSSNGDFGVIYGAAISGGITGITGFNMGAENTAIQINFGTANVLTIGDAVGVLGSANSRIYLDASI